MPLCDCKCLMELDETRSQRSNRLMLRCSGLAPGAHMINDNRNPCTSTRLFTPSGGAGGSA